MIILALITLAACVPIRRGERRYLPVPNQVIADWSAFKGTDSYRLVLESASHDYQRDLPFLPRGEGALGFRGVPNLIDRLCYGQPGLCGVTGGLEGGRGWFGLWDGPLPSTDDRASGSPNREFLWGQFDALLVAGKLWTLKKLERLGR